MATIWSSVLSAREYLCSSLKERWAEVAATGNGALCGTHLPEHPGANTGATGGNRLSGHLDADAESRYAAERTFVLNPPRPIPTKRRTQYVDGPPPRSWRVDRDTTVYQAGRA